MLRLHGFSNWKLLHFDKALQHRNMKNVHQTYYFNTVLYNMRDSLTAAAGAAVCWYLRGVSYQGPGAQDLVPSPPHKLQFILHMARVYLPLELDVRVVSGLEPMACDLTRCRCTTKCNFGRKYKPGLIFVSSCERGVYYRSEW